MAEHYHFSLKRHCHLEENGVLSYQGSTDGTVPIALLATQRPIRPRYSNHIEIEIIDEGQEEWLSVGIVPPGYSSKKHPGWGQNSAGYHADNGGIFFQSGQPCFTARKCTAGDRMGIRVIFSEGGPSLTASPTFIFTKNGQKVYECKWNALKDGSHHLAVCMESRGATVRLLDSDMWLLESQEDHQLSNEGVVPMAKHYHFSQKRHCHLAENGLLSYEGMGNGTTPIALLATQRPVRPRYSNHIEIEIIDEGQEEWLSVGIVPPGYSPKNHPGWGQNSAGYHADDGGIFFQSGQPCFTARKCTAGDRMGIRVIFSEGGPSLTTPPTFIFTKNGQKVFERKWNALKDGSHHLAVCMQSRGATVRLLDSDMWLLESKEDHKAQDSPSLQDKVLTSQGRVTMPCDDKLRNDEDDSKEQNSDDDDLPGFWDLAVANELSQLVPVFEREWNALKDGSDHLAVCMESRGATVRLLDSDMWLLESKEDHKAQNNPSLQDKVLTSQGRVTMPCDDKLRNDEDDSKEQNSEDDDLPGFWDLAVANKLSQLVPITKKGATFHEYEKIEMHFFETLSRDRFRILKIQRIQNPDLYRAFQFYKQRMGRRAATDAVEEKLLFHGTKQEYIEAICHQGFDSRMSGSTTGCLYGRGSYFAKGADYSRHYTDSQQLFVARVLVGHYTKGESFHKRPPPKDPKHPHGEAFDSCVDDMKNPRIFVVFSIEQAYPEYLIDFQKI